MATVKMTVEVSTETRDKLKALAKADGRVMMRYVEKLLDAHVARSKPRETADAS